jgi:Cu(I)/Ag(I) efflux system membrane protein CusA/SilA
VWAVDSVRKTPLDALPDLSDPQVIVYTEWMGRSPDLVEDQVTYPLVRALQSTPGIKTGPRLFDVRDEFTYAIFADGTDVYWARTRVLEQLGRAQQLLPPDVSPILGPDASGLGWVYQYILKDSSGRMDLAELRALQDFTVRPALQAVTGRGRGGLARRLRAAIPDRGRSRPPGGVRAHADRVTRSVRDANAEVGARVLELAGREYVLRGRGYTKTLADLEQSVVTVGARRHAYPDRRYRESSIPAGDSPRRVDFNGTGEAVGGFVVNGIRFQCAIG